jgi:hypothetical protein
MIEREHAIHDAYHAVSLAIELLAGICDNEESVLCIECAQSSAERLYKIVRAV